MLGLWGSAWLLGGAVASLPTARAAQQVMGVAPADQRKYTGQTFHCASGEGGELPYSAINDEYCDCADGSDEPGTGACAGQDVTHFYCANKGSTPRRLYASRVGDGICDCCDGSDEIMLVMRVGARARCENTCAEQGAIEREAAKRRIEELSQAVAKQKDIRAKALQDIDRYKSDRARLESELPALEEALSVAEKAAEGERAIEKEKKEAARKLKEEADKAKAAEEEAKAKASEEALKAAHGGAECRWRQTGGCKPDGEREQDKDKACSTTIEKGASGYCDCDGNGARNGDEPGYECNSPKPSTCVKACLALLADAQAASSEEKPQVSEYTKWMDGASDAMGAEEKGAATKAADGEQPQVSEYTKWMDGAEEVMTEDGAEEESQETDDQAQKPDEAAASAPAPTAIDVEREARKKVNDHKNRIKELQDNIDALPEDKLVYASLTGKTLETKVGEFKYKVSFFSNAYQDHTSLGHWAKWTGPTQGEFDKGTMCWGGPERKLIVNFVCGLQEELLDAMEPSRCVYEATVTTPGACSQQELDELTAGTRVVGVREEL